MRVACLTGVWRCHYCSRAFFQWEAGPELLMPCFCVTVPFHPQDFPCHRARMDCILCSRSFADKKRMHKHLAFAYLYGYSDHEKLRDRVAVQDFPDDVRTLVHCLRSQEIALGAQEPYSSGGPHEQASLEASHPNFSIQIPDSLPARTQIQCTKPPSIFNPWTSSQLTGGNHESGGSARTKHARKRQRDLSSSTSSQHRDDAALDHHQYDDGDAMHESVSSCRGMVNSCYFVLI